jgi:predicted HicB family RNase H-like nuclease
MTTLTREAAPELVQAYGIGPDSAAEILITFGDNGLSVDELEQSFHAAIDEYLEDCQALGKTPDKPFSGRFNLRISPELHHQAATKAEKKDISLNALVELALQNVT